MYYYVYQIRNNKLVYKAPVEAAKINSFNKTMYKVVMSDVTFDYI